jgi:hypothetical protein
MTDKEIELLKTQLHYNSITGEFTWLEASQGRHQGHIAGTLTKYDGIAIRVFGKQYHAHRLAWIFENGLINQSDLIVHQDKNRQNNAIVNLNKVDRKTLSQKSIKVNKFSALHFLDENAFEKSSIKFVQLDKAIEAITIEANVTRGRCYTFFVGALKSLKENPERLDELINRFEKY